MLTSFPSIIFSMALLAKQAWRLLHHTHSLFYRVYKAKYFPNCSFLEAEVGHNPSYVWRSLLAARDIIRAGSQWKVGGTVKKLEWQWIIGWHTSRFLQSNMLVSELIDEDTGQWNRQKVQELFAPSTRFEILAIPLNALHRRDELEWKENRARSFSVKDAYQVAPKFL